LALSIHSRDFLLDKSSKIMNEKRKNGQKGCTKATDFSCCRCWIIIAYLVFQSLLLILFHLKLEKIDIAPDAWLNGFISHGSRIRAHSLKKIKKKDARAYVRSFRNLDRPLSFFHIPKTAGTAIEHAAAERKIPWGSCLFNHKPKREICRRLYPKTEEWPEYVGWWHLPSQFFPLAESNPYQRAELFGVIRNPYDRMVSEFYYICTLKVTDWRPDQCHNRTRLFEKDYMNEWLTNKLKNRETGTSTAYLNDNGHFVPQYEFIVGPHGVRMLDYVLRLDDSLNSEFAQLMKAFGLEKVHLQKINAIGAEERDKGTNLDIKDLDARTIDWIHERYPMDFEQLEYEKQ